MSNQDRFLRHMPRDGAEFKRKFNLWATLHLDPPLLLALLLAAALGIFVLYSASGQNVAMTLKQCMSFGIGLTVMFVLAQVPPRTYETLSPWFYLGGVILLLAVAVIGEVRMGAQRWIDIPGFGSVQPSEFMKLGMPMMMAWFLGARLLPPRPSVVIVALGIILVPVLLVAEQPDLGTSLLVAASGLFVLFLAGLPWWMIAGFVAAMGPVVWVAWTHLLHDYQRQRVMTLFDPEADPLGAGWNIIQSKAALGSGGLTGKG
ncbi:MAG: FtsW/RodA/SpoVE family cell cycle protein, partial [Moraxellaceae bacterium]